ncbi:MAG: membrane protein insertase YidC [Thermoanaerobaculia bacterium]
MESKRLLIAALLSMAVIFLWQFFFAPPPPTAPLPAVEGAPSQTEAVEPRRPAGESEAEAGEAASGAESPDDSAALPASTREILDPIEGTREERVVLESEHARAVFSSRGAQLVSFELKKQRNGANGAVDLVHARAEGPWPFGLVTADGASLAPNDLLFAVEHQDADGVAFRYRGDAGAVEKRFSLEPNGLLAATVKADVEGSWAVLLGPALRELPAKDLDATFTGRRGVWLAGGDLGTVAPSKATEPTVLTGAGLSWVGLEDNYFLSAALPESILDHIVLAPYLRTEAEGGAVFTLMPPADRLTGGQKDLPRVLGIWLFPRGDELSVRAYLGVKRLETLKALPGGLDRTVLPGMMGLLARPLLYGLNWIYQHVVANYGWAIVLMTVVIKILLFPLTHKSYQSMQKMQELQPKVQAIRNKFRNKMRDKQGRPNLEVQRQMNDEMMAVYREAGVNPAGGCLPMLLQMPILFAFYRLLYSAVELRGAPWMAWIQDLSAYDPFYVLPIVMGATQFIQQKMTPMAGNPMQQRIFLLMPFFFTFLFLRFPAGLVLYWLVNNVLTIGQQWLIRRMTQAKAPQTQKAS